MHTNIYMYTSLNTTNEFDQTTLTDQLIEECHHMNIRRSTSTIRAASHLPLRVVFPPSMHSQQSSDR